MKEHITPDRIALLISIIGWIITWFKGGKYKKYFDAALQWGRIAAVAIERTESKSAKKIVKGLMKEATPVIKEVNQNIILDIDPVKAPPIKRFWKRFINKQNAAGELMGAAIKFMK